MKSVKNLRCGIIGRLQGSDISEIQKRQKTLEKHNHEENRSFHNFSFIKERQTFSYYFHTCFFPNPCFFFYGAQKGGQSSCCYLQVHSHDCQTPKGQIKIPKASWKCPYDLCMVSKEQSFERFMWEQCAMYVIVHWKVSSVQLLGEKELHSVVFHVYL